MKRNVTVAVVTAAVLVGGATAAVAFSDGGDRSPAASTRLSDARDRGDHDEREHRDDRDDRDDAAPGRTDTGAAAARSSLDRAVAAALRSVPGTVTEAELDDDDDRPGTVWEVDVHGTDNVWHDVTVDAASGRVLRVHDNRDVHRDLYAPRSAPVSLREAADAALGRVPGAITSIDLDGDGRRGDRPHWEVEITGEDGHEHELHVDGKTGEVTVDRDEDDHDD